MTAIDKDTPHFTARYVCRPDERRPSAHGSTICELADGTLLCAWYGGSREYGLDVSILGARLTPGAAAWEPAAVWADVPERTMGNPVLFPEPDGVRLWLFYVVLYGERWTTGRIHYRHSTDGGGTWGPELTLIDELGQMTRNKVYVRPDGAWLLPLYDERDWSAYMLISADAGRNWSRSASIRPATGVIQPSVVLSPDGRLLALMRTSGLGGSIWQAHSPDGGLTWSDALPSVLPNPNAACDAVATPEGAIVLAFNNTPSGRTPLNVALSEDGGQSWPRCRVVETGAGEFSYPAIIRAAGGLFHLTYTYRRTHIKHVTFNEGWLRAAAAGAP